MRRCNFILCNCSVGRHLNPNGLIDGTDALAHIGPYLASSAIDLITGACVVACLQLAQSVLFPPAPRVGKLGNDLAPQGAARPYEEACSGANVPWCYLAVSETTCATNQEIPSLKSVVRYSDAIIRVHV